MLHSLLRLSVGTVSALLIFGTGLIACIAGAFKLNLIWIDPRFVVYACAICLITTSFLLRIADARHAARWFAGLGSALIVSIIMSRTLTGTALGQSAITWFRMGTDRIVVATDLAETPKQTPCTPPLFIGDDGRSRYCWSPDDAVFTCYDRCGTHPDLGTPLLAITKPIAALISPPTQAPYRSKESTADPDITENTAARVEELSETTAPAMKPEPSASPPLSVMVEDKNGAQYALLGN